MRGPTLALLVMAFCVEGCDRTGILLKPGDVGVDREHEPDDVYEDPSWDPFVDPPGDPSLVDLPDDPCVGLTAPHGGICNIVEQCGCMPGFACDFQVDPATCMVIESCVAGSGTLPVDAECSGAGQCRPGTSCLAGDGETASRCREWCRDSSDCSIAGRECSEEHSFTMPSPCTGTATVPYMLCSLECPPSEECDLFATDPDPSGCPAGQACIRDNPIFVGGCDINMCVPEGPGEEGDDCTDSSGACRQGLGCYGNDTDGFHCMRYCDDTHGCPVGTCTVLDSESWPDLGICI
jgi:hypothetical protein